MPTEFLLPAFALTLLANAVLIAVAIRGLRRDHVDAGPARKWAPPVLAAPRSPLAPRTAVPETPSPELPPIVDPTDTPLDHAAPAAPAAPATPPLVAPSPARPTRYRPAAAAGSAPSAATDTAAAPSAPSDTDPAASTPAEAEPAQPTSAAAARSAARAANRAASAASGVGRTAASARGATRSVTARPTASGATRSTPAADAARPEPGTRRSRRKFSLPQMDEDHEKVNRSIKSFLAGAEGSAASPPSPGAGAATGPRQTLAEDEAADPSAGPSDDRTQADSSAASGAVPTTIAVVAIAGIDDAEGAPDDMGDDDPDSDTVTMLERAINASARRDALELLERTLRAAARGSDEVHGPDRGRFQIVLPATGELAARAYVRRIRGMVEPHLEAAERPLRLVVATATALNVPIGTATETAIRRLDTALAAEAEGATVAKPLDAVGDDRAGLAKAAPRPRTAGD